MRLAGISCRKEHAHSPSAEFVPGFDAEGMPKSRQGYQRGTRRLPTQGTTGQHYCCQKIHTLYDTHTDEDELFLNPDERERSTSTWRIRSGQDGICVDYDSSMNEGCSNRYAAMFKDGCSGHRRGGEQVPVRPGSRDQARRSVDRGQRQRLWPRVLLDGAEDHDGDGASDARMECSDPIDCIQKCRYLERTSRHGAGAPPTCALCDQYCPSNIVTTLTDLRKALWTDVLTIARLIGTCFGSVSSQLSNLLLPPTTLGFRRYFSTTLCYRFWRQRLERQFAATKAKLAIFDVIISLHSQRPLCWPWCGNGHRMLAAALQFCIGFGRLLCIADSNV